ncbi:hypothetical protein F511_41410 [Dorcoceras hygrometricum]|uniref:Uncharacterized protein n=1 Tax=Dorcoceras hygrometricum TaxID=472368 RepID=A0A2Z7DI62_9LAMI|nr:hypothetical protein F511_41410 [Dorcoceras hygrometricum]
MASALLSVKSIEQERSINRHLLYTIDAYLLTTKKIALLTSLHLIVYKGNRSAYDMVDRSQRKAKGFAAQIGVLLKGIPTITMGDGVPFPCAKILSMRTVHTYIVTNTTIDARAESEEPGMARTPKAKKKTSSVDEMPVDIFTEFTASKKRSATEADAPIITKKRRTGKAKLGEDEQVTKIAARKLCALICRDVEVLVRVRDSVMQVVVDFFASFSLNSMPDMESLKDLKEKERLMMAWEETNTLAIAVRRQQYVFLKYRELFSLNSMPDMESLKDLKEKERLMMAWAETNTLAIAVRRQLYVLIKYRELLLRTVLESYQRYLTPDLPWNAMAVQVANLLSVAHSHSLEDLKAQQQELNIEMVQSHSSLPVIDYIDSSCFRLAHFYSIANSSCWIRPVFLMNGVWTPVQVPWLMRIWRCTKVCEEVVKFSLSGSLRPVRKDVCHEITVYNLGVERIPANFLRVFAQGLSSHNFVDSVVQKDLEDIEEVILTDVEEVDLVSSDVSTVYRSPYPTSPGVDSLEHDLRFALGPAIFSRVGQEERLYFVQSPESPPAISTHHSSSSSSTDVSLHFDSMDVPVHAQADTQAPASVDFTKFTEALEDLQSSLAQRIHDSNCEMLSKLNAVELGVRGDLLKVQSLLRQSFETACRVLERQRVLVAAGYRIGCLQIACNHQSLLVIPSEAEEGET